MTGLRLDSMSGSAPGAMNSTPVQYDDPGDPVWVSTGVAAAGTAVQKAEAGRAGWMIPVTIRGSGPAVRWLPTRRPNRAAVSAVTATCTPAVEPPPAAGRRPATTWL